MGSVLGVGVRTGGIKKRALPAAGFCSRSLRILRANTSASSEGTALPSILCTLLRPQSKSRPSGSVCNRHISCAVSFRFVSGTDQRLSLAGPGSSRTAGPWRASAGSSSNACATRRVAGRHHGSYATGSSCLRGSTAGAPPTSRRYEVTARSVRSAGHPLRPRPSGRDLGRQALRVFPARSGSGEEIEPLTVPTPYEEYALSELGDTIMGGVQHPPVDAVTRTRVLVNPSDTFEHVAQRLVFSLVRHPVDVLQQKRLRLSVV